MRIKEFLDRLMEGEALHSFCACVQWSFRTPLAIIDSPPPRVMALKNSRLTSAFEDANSVLYALLIALFTAIRLWRLTTFSLRADEIFSLKAARHSWGGLFSVVIADVVHPPIFYVLLKSWIFLGGQSELWLRLFPVLTAIASIVPFTLLCRELHLSRMETNFALLLVSVNGYLIYYSQELRMYSLLLFLSLTSLLLFVRFLRAAPAGFPVPLFLVNLCLVYTQYYGWIVVFAELVILLVSRHQGLRNFSLSVLAAIVCFSPWAFLVGRVAVQRGGLESNIGSFPRPGFVQDVIGFYGTLSGDGDFSSGWKSIFGLLLCLVPILFLAISTGRNSEGEPYSISSPAILWTISTFAFLPVLISFGFSQFLPQSVWGNRFLIIVAVPYLILVTAAVFRIRMAPLKATAAILIAVWAVFSSVRDLGDTGKNAFKPLVYQMTHTEHASSGPVMIYTLDSSDETIQFYLDEAHDDRFRTKRVSSIDQMLAKHFWVVLRSSPDVLVKGGFIVGPEFRDGFGATLLQVSARGADSQ
jgi:uncharacterized membrane protein